METTNQLNMVNPRKKPSPIEVYEIGYTPVWDDVKFTGGYHMSYHRDIEDGRSFPTFSQVC